jgi:hypothetical protein
MQHFYVNSNPEEFDSNCLVCGGKNRDAIHHAQMTTARDAAADRTQREKTVVGALLLAYANSCKRSETRQKWTTSDQRSHDSLEEALLLFMDSSTLETSVAQIRGLGVIVG